jgi:Tol biopolymer transport system component
MVPVLVVLAAATWAFAAAPPRAEAAPPAGQIAYVHQEQMGSFSSYRDEVWLMNVDGSNAHRLCPPLGLVSDLQWSPDGLRLALAAQEEGQPPRLWIMKADGSARREIHVSFPVPGTFTATQEAIGGLAWSPDGERLALSYQANADGWTPWASWILILKLSSSGLSELTGPSDELAYHELAWAPDGSEIVACTSSVVGESAWLTRLDAATGTDLGKLSEQGYFEFWSQPAFSPDGRRIACSISSSAAIITGEGETFDSIALVSEDGTSRRVVARSTQDFLVTPSWSPDGKWLVAGRGGRPRLRPPLRLVILAAEENGREIDTGVNGWHPAWRPVLPPPAPTLRIANDDLVEGESLRVSGEVKDDGHGDVGGVAVYVGKQRWKVTVNGSGRYAAELRPLPGDYRVTAAALRQGLEGERSAAQPLRLRSKSAVLFGFDEGLLGTVHSAGPIKSWVQPLADHGWTSKTLVNGDAGTAARLMQGKGFALFYGHGLSVTPDGKDPVPGYALAFGESYLATTGAVAGYAPAASRSKWERLDQMDLSALEVAVYLGCGTGANSGNSSSLLRYTTDAGAAVAVGFTRGVHSLFESTPWLNAFRDYALSDGLDVRTAAFRADQDCALLTSMTIVRQRSDVAGVYLNRAPPRVEAVKGGGE